MSITGQRGSLVFRQHLDCHSPIHSRVPSCHYKGSREGDGDFGRGKPCSGYVTQAAALFVEHRMAFMADEKIMHVICVLFLLGENAL
jgi:hypothetical protein